MKMFVCIFFSVLVTTINCSSSPISRPALADVKYHYFSCESSEITQISFGPILIPEEFTILFWFKHVGCTESSSTAQAIVYANNFLNWIYNTETNTYHVTLQNSTHTRSLKANTTIILNRWSHLAFQNYGKTGAQMILNLDNYILSETYADIKMASEDYVFLGSSYLPSINRFSGYLSNFRIITAYLSPFFIQQYSYFRSVRDTTINNLLVEVFGEYTDTGQVFYHYKKMKLLGTAPDLVWTEVNPFCSQNYFFSSSSIYSINARKDCQKPEKIIYFDGTFYFQPLDVKISATAPSFLSFWLKFIKNEHTSNDATLFLYDSVFRVDYDRSVGSDSTKASSSQITYTHLINSLSTSLPLPRHENVWWHVTCSHTSTGPMILWIGGIGQIEASPSTGNLESDGSSHSIYIAGTTSFTYFTGSMREIMWTSETFADMMPIVTRGKKMSKIEIENLLPILFFTPSQEENSMYYLYTSGNEWKTKMEANVKYIDDTNPTLLCEPESVAVPNFREKAIY